MGEIPRVFDKYEIIRRLAVGGMGEIFLARQVGVARFERLAILKSLLPDLSKEERAVKDFLHEARVAATLNHPNVVNIYEVGEWEAKYFIAMEYIRGESISRLASEASTERKPLSDVVAARIVMDAALGLAHAHKATGLGGKPLNIVHRDISPQNIMVRDDGVAKVVDFGIAKVSDKTTATKTGFVKGKLGYFPPESLKDEKPDHRSDQYSLGVVLWELLAKRRLFKDRLNQLKLLTRIAEGDIPALTDVRSEVDTDLAAITMRMLSNDPGERYGSCEIVADSLGEWIDRVTEGRGGEADRHEVASLVQTLVGSELDARESDLTPSDRAELEEIFNPPQPVESNTVTVPGRPGRTPAEASAAAEVDLAAAAAGTARAVGPMPPAPPGPLVPAAEASDGMTVLDPDTVSDTVADVRVRRRRPLLALTFGGAAVITVALVLAAGSVGDGAPSETAEPTSGGGAAPPVGAVDAPVTPPAAPSADASRDAQPADAQPEAKPEPKAKRKPKRPTRPKPRAQPTSPLSAPIQPLHATPSGAFDGVGYVSVDAKPWAEVYVNGQPMGVTPKFRIPVAAGSHLVRLLNAEAGIDVTRKVHLKPNTHAKLIYPW